MDDTRVDRTERLRADATDALEARLVAAHAHVERVVDVGRAASGDLLVVLEPAPVALPTLLGTAGGIVGGEAVTVLAPLADALAAAHAAGVAHGAVAPAAIRFDAAGRPIWCGFAGAVLRRTAAPAAFESAVAGDERAFAELQRTLLRLAGFETEASALVGVPLAAASEALFGLADPLPVRLRPVPPQEPVWPPSRLSPVRDAERVERPRPLARLRALLQPVRPRAWVALGAAGALLAGAVVLLPSRGADAEPPSSIPSPVAARPSAEAVEVAPRALGPAAAAAALLAVRGSCLARSDRGCLARTDAAGSPLLTTDRRAVDAGTDPVLPGGAARLVWRGGGSALIAVGQADVLVVQEPAGWRLRDVTAARSAR